MKFGVADYGMNVWAGGLYNIEDRLRDLKKLGFNGTERLEAVSPSDALYKAALYRKLGMDFSTCRGPSVQVSTEWTAALGKNYVWLTPGPGDRAVDFKVYCRRANAMIKACAGWGITASIHNHMHSRIESQNEFENFLKACPDAGIVLDTGHLSMAGGDPAEIVKKYHKRISVVHLKDVFLTGGMRPDGIKAYRFCELGAGNNGFDNASAIEMLLKVGWDGWIHIEHDEHQRDPLKDLAVSLNYVNRVIGNKRK